MPAKTTGAMPFPRRARPFSRAMMTSTAAMSDSPPPRISPMKAGIGMRMRPRSPTQKAAQAVGFERRSVA